MSLVKLDVLEATAGSDPRRSRYRRKLKKAVRFMRKALICRWLRAAGSLKCRRLVSVSALWRICLRQARIRLVATKNSLILRIDHLVKEYVVSSSISGRSWTSSELVQKENGLPLAKLISNLAHAGVLVPRRFCHTADAYREFLEQSGSATNVSMRRSDALGCLEDVNALARTRQKNSIREWVMDAHPEAAGSSDRSAFAGSPNGTRIGCGSTFFCYCRKDLCPMPPFAGQQGKPSLNIRGRGQCDPRQRKRCLLPFFKRPLHCLPRAFRVLTQSWSPSLAGVAAHWCAPKPVLPAWMFTLDTKFRLS